MTLHLMEVRRSVYYFHFAVPQCESESNLVYISSGRVQIDKRYGQNCPRLNVLVELEWHVVAQACDNASCYATGINGN